MIRLIYNLLFPLGFLFFLPAYLLKMRRRGNYQRNFGQRFGCYSETVRMRLAAHSFTWIHAVSVGEVAIALKLAAKLRELDQTFHCALTTTTTTGFAFAEKEAPEWIEVMYNPLDFWPIVRRAFAMIRPVRLLLVEAEVWPNLAAAARDRQIPLALVNARLSPRSCAYLLVVVDQRIGRCVMAGNGAVVCQFGQNGLCQHLAQLHAHLIK